jgi:membrane protease YdiL (CAAX protease family)
MLILFTIGMLIMLGFVSFATFRTSEILKTWTPEENLLLIPAENIVRLVMIAVCVGLGFLSPVGIKELGWIPTDPLGDIGIGVVVGLGISLVAGPLTVWVIRHHPEWYSDVVLQSILPRSRREWPLVILALLPTVLLEELLFRSLLLGGFGPYVNILFFAVAASILFGLLHRPQGEWGVAAVTVVALILSALFLWRVSLLVVVVAHWVTDIAQLVQAERQKMNEGGVG